MDVNPTSTLSSVAPTAILAAEQSPATPASDDVCQRILERIIASSQPVPPPAMWVRFGSTSFVRRLSCELRDLLSQLAQQFTADQLLAARVAMPMQSGELKVSKVLATDEAFLIRGDATGRAAGDIVSHRGKLSSGTFEWRELAEQTTNGNSADETPIVVGASDAELYVMVCLGIRCTPLAGIDQVIGKQVRALFKKRPQHAQQRRHQMVLLGWQPDRLSNEPSARNLAAIRHVAAIQLVYGFDPHTVFSVWLPSRAELVRIRRAHSFVDCKIVADEFRSSLRNSAYAPADALALLADRRRATWAEAREALESAIERSIVVPRISEASVALAKLERAYHEQVVRPLEAAIGKTGLEALHSLMGAVLAAIWYEDLELVHAGRRVIAGQFPSYAKRVDDAALNRKLRLVSAVVNLAREVKKMTASCRIESMMNPNHNNFAACDDDTVRFPGSDSGSPHEDHFTERIGAFEQCSTSGSPGITNFLRVAAADLFRTMPLIERSVVDELTAAFQNPFEHKRPALRQYVRTLQVLRRALQASVSLETQAQPSAMTIQSQKTKRDQS